MRAYLLGLLALFCFPAWSQINYGSSTGYVNPAPANTMQGTADFERFMRTATGGKADLVDRYTGKIGGKSFPLDHVRRFDKAALARALVKGAGRISPAALVGSVVVAGILDAAWCKVPNLVVCRETQGTVPVETFAVSSFSYWPGSAGVHFSALAAAESFASRAGYKNPALTCNTWYHPQCSGPVDVCSGNPVQCTRTTMAVQVTRSSQQLCPTVPGMAGYEQPGGPTNNQGRCPTATEQPLAEAEAETRLAPHMADAQVEPVARHLVGNGVEPDPVWEKVEGPATLPDVPTTRTTTPPGGTPQTTTIQNTYNITYDQRQFSWTTTTTTTAPDGTVTEEGEKPKEKTECELNPNSLGCMELGDPPDDQVSKGNQTLGFSAEAIGLPAGCPAPVSLPGGLVVDYTPMCTTAEGFRPFIVAAGAFSACLIVLAAVRS